MILTTPNLEKSIKAIAGFFKRNKHNVRDYELKELENLLKHTESSLKSNVGKYSLTENLVLLLMFHYTVYHGSPKLASQQLRNDIRLGKDLSLMKLHNAIVSKAREEVLSNLNDASPEQLDLIIEKIINEYSIEKIIESITKTTHDLLTIHTQNNNGEQFF